uniref:Uncharacterized protein n=1 Tax=Tanacetum cinerariifolium TaxID=118510 RepID=A0A6L2MSX1_TANCI|nr:hypothetical protein [Tanacetum cinerariifolium]
MVDKEKEEDCRFVGDLNGEQFPTLCSQINNSSENDKKVCNDKLEKNDNYNILNVGVDVNVECSVKNANKIDDCVNNENSDGKMYNKDTKCCNDGGLVGSFGFCVAVAVFVKASSL